MIKDKGKVSRIYSLRMQMLIALLVGIVLAVVVFFVIKLGSGAYIGYLYTSEESRMGRENGYAEELQRYVDEHGLSSADVSELADWARGHRYLYVMVHKDDELLFEWGAQDDTDKNPEGTDQSSPGKGDDIFPDTGLIPERPTREELIAYAKEKDAYPIIMADDAAVLVSMADYTEYWYYDLFNIASLVAAMLVLVLAVMLYIGRVTGRISTLARDVAAVADGDMGRSIHIDGTDEIGQLSGDVENMRNSILEKVEREREAVEANTELITSMSHDIRTPLTVLLGYLDIMKRKNDDSAMDEYIDASQKTALRLKKISDDLFNYFLVFGGGGAALEPELYDAATLLTQMLEEHVLLLREQGYEILPESDMVLQGVCASVWVDAPALKRIFENLFSNIMKYASKERPVEIKAKLSDGRLTLSLQNEKRSEAERVESNGIGTKTCRKLAEAIGIGFDIEDCPGTYKTTLTFDVAENAG